jgi:chromosomal replication initiator protein
MDDLLGPARHARFVLPRHIALYLCACYTDTALIDISFKFGARNHTAAWDAMQRIKRKAARFPHVQRIVDILKTKILTAAGRV